MSAGRIPTTANSPLTTKGDLFTYSTSPARLAVGANGEQIVADSSTSTGLRYNANYAAGKNKVINGDFYWNQRNFTSGTAGGEFFADRTFTALSGATGTTTRELFTVGQTAVPGNPLAYGKMVVTTGNDFARFIHRIEDVSTFAGQTATLSFYAKGVNPTTAGKLNVRLQQNFGGGGSTSVDTAEQDLTLTASFVRYSYTFSVPSISGKTVGSGNFLSIDIGQLANTSTDGWTLEVAQIQLEAGSVATAFQTATGTLQGELAACQRYYWRGTGPSNTPYGGGASYSTTKSYINVQFPVTMRVSPTSIDFSSLYISNPGLSSIAVTNVTQVSGGTFANTLEATVASGATAQVFYTLQNNGASGYLGLNAEL